MPQINLNLSEKEIFSKYFIDLCCDDYIHANAVGGQSYADEALRNLNINSYSKKRNNVYPFEKRGSSMLSPYIRHGLLSLNEVWIGVDKFEYEDKTKFRDELLWQEFSRHLYAIIGKNSNNFLNFSIDTTKSQKIKKENMNCLNTIKKELESTGYMVNQARMWFASHYSLRVNESWTKYENYMFRHLVDGSRFANRLGWHWVMGSQTGKTYGFAKSQVIKRAPKLCNDCELKYNCPIESWPELIESKYIEKHIQFNTEKSFGPNEIKEYSNNKPNFVWITAESMGDNDPAMSFYSDLPIIFIFDKKLLSKLKLSSKRIIFLLETLKEINRKRELYVYLDNPKNFLNNKNFATTFAPVPGYKNITSRNKPNVEFPAKRLVKPIDFYPQSFSSWRKKSILNV